ncbi:twin-arginine translocase TatA/TatE family subunit [Flavobacterium cellulosilyticum]|uniref:Twin-arginine translocase TatA/TatE family subunit n=1 Tax=Flavobacterium cellulosilyticum TaxID=2541731 RepID=A0A4R5CAC2_9FLAO|nr:twin-arginine translocase TatA/TatE family subunit [Flavobacterium cellulosilyticum]
MFGIGGGELIFILFVVLMLFGSDKVPEIARTMGKAMAQLKNATNDIKNEIQKGAEENGLDKNLLSDITSSVTSEINKTKDNLIGNNSDLKGIKDTFTTELDQTRNSILSEPTNSASNKTAPNESESDTTITKVSDEVKIPTEKSAEVIEEITGPIKRKK